MKLWHWIINFGDWFGATHNQSFQNQRRRDRIGNRDWPTRQSTNSTRRLKVKRQKTTQVKRPPPHRSHGAGLSFVPLLLCVRPQRKARTSKAWHCFERWFGSPGKVRSYPVHVGMIGASYFFSLLFLLARLCLDLHVCLCCLLAKQALFLSLSAARHSRRAFATVNKNIYGTGKWL